MFRDVKIYKKTPKFTLDGYSFPEELFNFIYQECKELFDIKDIKQLLSDFDAWDLTNEKGIYFHWIAQINEVKGILIYSHWQTVNSPSIHKTTFAKILPDIHIVCKLESSPVFEITTFRKFNN